MDTPGRIGAGILALATFTLLVIAWRLNPSGDGHGTHTQLGLPPCAWAAWFGKPCVTCGMTTAVSHAADGHLLRSALTQPAGMLFALGCSVAFWISVYVAATGSRIGSVALTLIGGRRIWLWAGVTLAAWIYKMITWTN